MIKYSLFILCILFIQFIQFIFFFNSSSSHLVYNNYYGYIQIFLFYFFSHKIFPFIFSIQIYKTIND